MTESAWEQKRRNERKRLLVLLLGFVVLGAAGTVLFLNNRDLIGTTPDTSAPVSSTAPPAGQSEEVPVTSGRDSLRMHTNPDTLAVPVDGSVSSGRGRTTSEDTSASGASYRKIAKKPVSVPESHGRSSPTANSKCCSIVLPAIACGSENRKDVVINLSLELFFTDNEQRSAILLRREDIKVMVLRTMRGQQLPAVKIHKLESLLQKNIVSLFDDSVITRVNIRNIQIEKSAG